jgi:hypothetical protein
LKVFFKDNQSNRIRSGLVLKCTVLSGTAPGGWMKRRNTLFPYLEFLGDEIFSERRQLR